MFIALHCIVWLSDQVNFSTYVVIEIIYQVEHKMFSQIPNYLFGIPTRHHDCAKMFCSTFRLAIKGVVYLCLCKVHNITFRVLIEQVCRALLPIFLKVSFSAVHISLGLYLQLNEYETVPYFDFLVFTCFYQFLHYVIIEFFCFNLLINFTITSCKNW